MSGHSMPYTSPAASDPTERIWSYWTHEGKVGPISTSEFVKAVEDGRISPSTRVQLAHSCDSMAAQDIAGLPFPLPDVTRPLDRIAESSLHSHNSRQMQQLFVECLKQNHGPQHKKQELFPARSYFTLSLQPRLLLNSVMGHFGTALTPPARIALCSLRYAMESKITWAILFAVVAVTFSAPIVSRSRLAFMTQQQLYLEVKSLYSQIKQEKAANGDFQLPAELRQRIESKLKCLVPELQRRAHVEDRAAMAALWVSRDFLPLLISADQRRFSELESKLAAHFDIADAASRKLSFSSLWIAFASKAMLYTDVGLILCILSYFGVTAHARS